MLQPAKMKFMKLRRFRKKLYGVATSGTLIAFGAYGLKAMENGQVSARQLEAARKSIANYIKRGGKIWIRVFPHFPITKKAAEVPMGAGKGSIEFYAAHLKAGHVIFEMDGTTQAVAKEALTLAGSKLPIRTKFVMKF